jgi:hypothetical protein
VHLELIGHANEDHFVKDHLAREEREIMPAGARQYLMNGLRLFAMSDRLPKS